MQKPPGKNPSFAFVVWGGIWSSREGWKKYEAGGGGKRARSQGGRGPMEAKGELSVEEKSKTETV